MLLVSLLTTLPFSFPSFVLIIVLFVVAGGKRIGMACDVHCPHLCIDEVVPSAVFFVCSQSKDTASKTLKISFC